MRDLVSNNSGGTFQGVLRTFLSLYVYPIVSISGRDKWLQGAAQETKLVWQPGVAWALGGPHLRQTPRHIRATPNHLTNQGRCPLQITVHLTHKDTETNDILPLTHVQPQPQPTVQSISLLDSPRLPKMDFSDSL